jgi:metallo-beta-lactamase family protein
MGLEKLKINFYGAAGTVTGSKFLIEFRERRILIDCGLFQGLKSMRLLNWEHLNVPASSVDTVLLTHGHLDHCGYLPRLMHDGFKGRIHGTLPTLEIAEIILNDSARIHEEEAERANKYGYSKHKPAKPLYTVEDVANTISHFKAEPLDHWINLGDEIQCRFRYNGHIIGATFIELNIKGKRIVFSGDIGRRNDLLMRAPEQPEDADIIIIESTYGDTINSQDTTRSQLADVVNRTVERAGSVIIPSFAVERAQTLMYLLWMMREAGEIPKVEVYLDSPMGSSVLEVFKRYRTWHKLTEAECLEMCKDICQLQSLESTYAVIDDYHPKIVIAGSGMITGGRVLRYLEKYLGDESTTVLLAGFQSEGTRGRELQEGAKQIRINGKMLDVHAEIKTIAGLSAHADQSELLWWLEKLKKAPEKIAIVHGETTASEALRKEISAKYGYNCIIPAMYEVLEVEIP